MGSGGGSRLIGGLEELKKELDEYFGALNEVKMGHPALKVKIPEKPAALKKWETCQIHRLPLVAGGLIDQPYLWLLEVKVIVEAIQQFEALEALNKAQE